MQRRSTLVAVLLAVVIVGACIPRAAHASASFEVWNESRVVVRPDDNEDALAILRFEGPTVQSATLSLSCHPSEEHGAGLRVHVHSGRKFLHMAFDEDQQVVASLKLDALRHVVRLSNDELRTAHIALPQAFAYALPRAQQLHVSIEGGGHVTSFAAALPAHQQSIKRFFRSCGISPGEPGASAESALR
jgi:hypothetical protein